jgi:transposase-like protein
MKTKKTKNAIVCPECGHKEYRKCGHQFNRDGKVQRVQCKKCGRYWLLSGEEENQGLDRPKLPKCPDCGSTSVRKYGTQFSRRGQVRRWQCKKCARFWLDNYA